MAYCVWKFINKEIWELNNLEETNINLNTLLKLDPKVSDGQVKIGSRILIFDESQMHDEENEK